MENIQEMMEGIRGVVRHHLSAESEKVKSTMDSIKEIIKKKTKNVILIADEQTEGRGRRGNKWISPKGNIYCSIATM